jgi:hypothetical protein
MLAKKNVVIQFPPRNASTPPYRKELESLYARRSALASVIARLEDYDRFRAKRVQSCQQTKSA